MQQIKKRYIRLKTERFLVKTLSENDACVDLANWFSDRELMAGLNKKPRKILMSQVRQWISSHDQAQKLLVGIFAEKENKLIGYYTVKITPVDRRAVFTVVVGDRDYWGSGTVLETRAALMDYLFANAHIDKVVGTPLARNFPAIFNYKAQGWRPEGILKKHVIDSSQPSKRLDLYMFGLLKEDWYRQKAADAQSKSRKPETAAASP